MRIISGFLRGRRLRAPDGLATRPTSDRVREGLFNILAPRIEGSRFLDVCAGSGMRSELAELAVQTPRPGIWASIGPANCTIPPCTSSIS